MKIFTKKEILPIFIILMMLIIAGSLWDAPCLPDRMPSHWNAAGEVDGWSSKNFTLLFAPLLALGIYLLMLFLPKLDPLRKNYVKFVWPYYVMRLAIIVFLALLYLYMIMAGLGYKVNINYFLIPLFGFMFIAIGLAMPKIKKNYFVGIRTPWTLQSDEVWEKTHQFGGKAFVAAGILTLPAVFFGEIGFWIFISLVLLASFGSMGYSYFVYRRLGLFKKKNSS